MFEVLLTPADCGTSWRHQLAEGEARAGWECAGPLGLARRLGRILGLSCEPAPVPDRLAAWAARLERHDDGKRTYSESRRSDPTGVASSLLSLRDRLRLAGWRGDPVAGGARLADLAALEVLGAPPLPAGFADLVADLVSAVEKARKLPVAMSVRLGAPREGFPPLLVALLDALARAGAKIAEAAADSAAAGPDRDLGKLQRALLDPAAPPARLAGDGSFLLLEADTPLEAAELAAAVLRERPLSTTTAVVADEAGALDAALFRQGLPTLGLSSPSRWRPHLQALPLRLALAFRPRDPFRAAELLLLPGAPLPARVRRRLLGALEEMPGIGSPAWRVAVETAIADEVGRAREGGAAPAGAEAAGRDLADRIEAWFGGEGFDAREGIPAASAAALCGMVAGWAGGRAAGAEREGNDLDAALWSHSAAVARTLQRMLAARPPAERMPQLALAQLHDVAAGDGSDLAAFGGEAGRPAICRAPAEVLPGAATVLWFGFVEDAAPGPGPGPWTEPERAALSSAGVRMPQPGEARRFEAWGWRRPVLHARERVALVRWRLSGPDPVGPHPFVDEIRTRLAPGSLEACALGSERLLAGLAAAASPWTQDLAPAPAVAPRAVWHVPPRALVPREPLSPTSLEALLGCPFRWALEHQGQLRPGRGLEIPEGSRLLGGFAHRILQDMVLGEGHLDVAEATPQEARAWALRAFDARVASEAAPLVRPGAEVERDAARTLVGGAAAALQRHLGAGKWAVKAVEQEVTGTFAGHRVHGYVDLVLERAGQPALLDLKLSGAGHRREDLEQGKALQIALYSSMLGGDGRELPPAGFLTLDDGQLLTVSPQAFPGATAVDGPSTRETLGDAERRFTAWKAVLARGVLPLCAGDLPWEERLGEEGGALPDGGDPDWRDRACIFCRFTTLCRARVGQEDSP